MVGCYTAMDYLPVDLESGGGGGGGVCISEEEVVVEEEEQEVVVGTTSTTTTILVLDDDVKLLETKTAATTKVVEEKKLVKDRRSNSKKPPRPPRSSKPLSLDAADQKLIKEISQLIILKRARVERMKALKIKSAKPNNSSSSSSSLNGNLFAMICTILFCFVFIFQGFSSGGTTTTTNKAEIVGQGLISSSYVLPIPPLNYASMKPNVEEDADATTTSSMY